MIKVITFVESDLSKMENELNIHLKTHDILHIWSTGYRVVFILKKRGPGRPKAASSEEE